jgi:hypothetical protein
MARPKRFELLTPRFVVYTRALILRHFLANRTRNRSPRINRLAVRLQTISSEGQPPRVSGSRPSRPIASQAHLQIPVEAELACSARPRRYCFYYDEVAEAEAQGLPYVLVPRVLSRREWMERYAMLRIVTTGAL